VIIDVQLLGGFMSIRRFDAVCGGVRVCVSIDSMLYDLFVLSLCRCDDLDMPNKVIIHDIKNGNITNSAHFRIWIYSYILKDDLLERYLNTL
jgi:hypothetical protein